MKDKICGYIYTHASGYKEYCPLPKGHEFALLHGAGGCWKRYYKGIRMVLVS